jgi:hypothetical protein
VTRERRRVAVGEKIELTAAAHDAKGAPIPDVKYEARVEREKADSPVASPLSDFVRRPEVPPKG